MMQRSWQKRTHTWGQSGRESLYWTRYCMTSSRKSMQLSLRQVFWGVTMFCLCFFSVLGFEASSAKYWGPLERQRLQERLFVGLTANIVKVELLLTKQEGTYNMFKIKEINFSRANHIAEVTVDLQTQTIFHIENIEEPREDMQRLRDLLKKPQNADSRKAFYQLYSHKLIIVDFGFIELYNIRSTLEHKVLDRNQNCFIRWGRFNEISIKDIRQKIICDINYYNLLARERLFSLWACLNNCSDWLRKSYPYKYCHLFDLQDTVQISIKYLNSQNFHSTDYKEMSASLTLLKKKQEFFQLNYLVNIFDTSKHILIPFKYIIVEHQDIKQIDILLLHLTKQTNGLYDIELHIFAIERYEFLDQLKNLMKSFLNSLKIKINASNFTITQSNLTQPIQSYAEYIETKIFLYETTKLKGHLYYLFETLPEKLSLQDPYATLCDDSNIDLIFQKKLEEEFNKIIQSERRPYKKPVIKGS